MIVLGVPPPSAVVAYTLEYRGNQVYRVECAELLSEMPAVGDSHLELLGGVTHLVDALETLGLKADGQWLGYFAACNDNDMNPPVRVIAWRIP